MQVIDAVIVLFIDIVLTCPLLSTWKPWSFHRCSSWTGVHACCCCVVPTCPRISQDRTQQRLVDRDLRHPQMAEQLVDVPSVLSLHILVPRTRGDQGGFHGFPPRPGSSQRTVEQIVDIPEESGQVFFFFALIPGFSESAESAVQVSVKLGGHVSSSTLSAYQMSCPMSTWTADIQNTWRVVRSARVGSFWVNTSTWDSQWHPPWEHLPGKGPPPDQGVFL